MRSRSPTMAHYWIRRRAMSVGDVPSRWPALGRPRDRDALERCLDVYSTRAGATRCVVWAVGNELHLRHLVCPCRTRRVARRRRMIPVLPLAAAWLKSRQNANGGWGESCVSYWDHGPAASSDGSTACQTAWALLGLMDAGEWTSPRSASWRNVSSPPSAGQWLLGRPVVQRAGLPSRLLPEIPRIWPILPALGTRTLSQPELDRRCCDVIDGGAPLAAADSVVRRIRRPAGATDRTDSVGVVAALPAEAECLTHATDSAPCARPGDARVMVCRCGVGGTARGVAAACFWRLARPHWSAGGWPPARIQHWPPGTARRHGRRSLPARTIGLSAAPATIRVPCLGSAKSPDCASVRPVSTWADRPCRSHSRDDGRQARARTVLAPLRRTWRRRGVAMPPSPEAFPGSPCGPLPTHPTLPSPPAVLGAVDESGRVQPGRLLAALARHPSQLVMLPPLLEALAPPFARCGRPSTLRTNAGRSLRRSPAGRPCGNVRPEGPAVTVLVTGATRVRGRSDRSIFAHARYRCAGPARAASDPRNLDGLAVARVVADLADPAHRWIGRYRDARRSSMPRRTIGCGSPTPPPCIASMSTGPRPARSRRPRLESSALSTRAVSRRWAHGATVARQMRPRRRCSPT